MALTEDHPDYKSIQDKLDEMRERITQKRENAIQMFDKIKDLIIKIEQEMGPDLPDEVKQQLDQIKTSLKIDKNKEDLEKETAEEKLEVTNEDILRAVQSLINSSGAGAKIAAAELREELRKIIGTRLAAEGQKQADRLVQHANAQDFMNVIDKLAPDAAKQMGGSDKMLEQSMKLAEQAYSMFSSLNVKMDTNAPPAPDGPSKGGPQK